MVGNEFMSAGIWPLEVSPVRGWIASPDQMSIVCQASPLAHDRTHSAS